VKSEQENDVSHASQILEDIPVIHLDYTNE